MNKSVASCWMMKTLKLKKKVYFDMTEIGKYFTLRILILMECSKCHTIKRNLIFTLEKFKEIYMKTLKIDSKMADYF